MKTTKRKKSLNFNIVMSAYILTSQEQLLLAYI